MSTPGTKSPSLIPRRPLYRNFIPIVFILSFFLGASGCSIKSASHDADANYIKRLHDWTRSVKVLEGLSTRLYLSATYKTMDFRAAYVERYSAAYEVDEEARLKLLKKEEADAAMFDDFFVVAYTPRKEWNDLDKKDSMWRLFLQDSAGRRIEPASISKVSRVAPLVKEFFPHLDEWSIAYEVRFLKSAAEDGENPDRDGSVKLMITSVLGKGELAWIIREIK